MRDSASGVEGRKNDMKGAKLYTKGVVNIHGPHRLVTNTHSGKHGPYKTN